MPSYEDGSEEPEKVEKMDEDTGPGLEEPKLAPYKPRAAYSRPTKSSRNYEANSRHDNRAPPTRQGNFGSRAMPPKPREPQ
jgi:hypothetical protein